ncbi:2-hydroxyacid dehydrogenase [Microscilla marina]|uniref:D-3-phosphoglycerate dehydrogenase n=1 Tax=Microscilla marina ATCC 23134 TaxID=313606 RepID=A2A023_MICM2|nr:2-hydroxyacid dehydrogenase [Microscilla marina]EAY24018.1 D-3-phosphoglycerate dehydrogenase [Microscilla marina ATCC 23134]
MAFNILIIDKMHPSITSLLESRGIQGDYRPDITRAEILTIVDKYEGLMVRSKTAIDEDLIGRASRLKVIARAGAGLDKIDLSAANARGIKVLNAPEGNRDAVGEQTIGMLLSLLHNVQRADWEVKNFAWKREANRGVELMDKVVGVIGYGNMGKAFAKRLSSFGCKDVIAYDRRPDRGDEYARQVSMDEVFERAEIISLHVPLDEYTYELVDDDFLDCFEHNIYLVNTARGKVLVLDALQRKIQEGKVLGAALDVLENEKLQNLSEAEKQSFEFLRKSPHIIMTPHIAGWTHESFQKINEVLVDKIQQYLQVKEKI